MSAEQEARIDALAAAVPGVAEIYEATRPLSGRVALRKLGMAVDAPKSFVRGVGALAEVTVSVGLRPDARAEVVRDAIADAVRALPGLDESRVHVRISRVHREDSAAI